MIPYGEARFIAEHRDEMAEFLAAVEVQKAALARHLERQLLPAEKIALTVAVAQVRRGEQPTPNVTAVCIEALARLSET